MDELQAKALEEFTAPDSQTGTGNADASDYPEPAAVKKAFAAAEQAIVRERILSTGKRPDGREPTQLRDIWAEVDLSPRAHGSGLFTRGET